MKRSVGESAWALAFLWFALVQACVAVAFFLLGLYSVSQPCRPRGPSDPCDGPAMLAMALWIVAVPAGFVAGLGAVALAYWYAKFAGRQHPSIPSILPEGPEKLN